MSVPSNNCERILPTLIVLLVFTCLLFLAGLERRHLWNDEPRVAGIVAEMARSGNLVVPRLNNRRFLEKPPLYFWAVSTAFRFFGENTYTARLISALSAIGGVVIVFFLARSMHISTRGAFISGFVLATSAEYWSLGRRCLVDMMLCFFITAAMASFYQVVRSVRGRFFWYIIFVFSLSDAVLTKGLVGLAVPFSALVIWLVVEKDFFWQRWLALLTGSVLCCIPAAVWIWLLYNKLGRGAVYEAVWVNNFGRFTGGYPEHLMPFYYYLTKFPIQFIPWTFFLPLTGYLLIRETRCKDKINPALFILTWLIVPFVLLSISAGKRGIYLLPIYPAAALAVGYTVDTVLSGKEKLTAWFDIPSSILAGIAVLTPLVFLGIYLYLNQSIIILALVSIPEIGLGLWSYHLLTKKDLNSFFKMLVPAFLLIFLTFDIAIAPIANMKNSFEPIFNYCRNLKSEGIQIGLINPKENMIGAAVFYLGSRIPILYKKRKIDEFLKSEAKTAAIVKKNLNDPGEFNMLFKSIISKDEIVVVRARATKGKQDHASGP